MSHPSSEQPSDDPKDASPESATGPFPVQSAEVVRPRPKFNIAILTGGLVIGILLVGYSNVQSSFENRKLEEENLRLREQIERLTDSEPRP